MLDNFVKSYPKPVNGAAFKHTAMVRHNGTVIAFAVNEDRRIFYSVLDLNDQSTKGPLDVNYWQNNPQTLTFPNEIVTVGEGLFDPLQMPVYKKGSSEPEAAGTRVRENEKDQFRSTTASLSDNTAFHVMSDNKFVYLFRQSVENSDVDLAAGVLLVDRFILSGTVLLNKREVRYQRSRNKYQPQSRKDSLGAKDMEKNPFFEPTQKLSFIRNLVDGRFTSLLLPTQIANLQRWQIFAHNVKTGMIDSFNIERAADGLFNLKGTQPYTCPDHPEVYSLKDGACPEPAKADATQNCPYALIPVLSKEGYAEWALTLDGSDDSITLEKPLEFEHASYQTIEFWLQVEDLTNQQTLLSVENQEAGSIFIDTDGTLKYLYLDENGATQQFSSVTALEAGLWHHVVLVRDDEENMLSWYVDGSQANDLIDIAGAATANSGLIFGSGNWGFLKGKIDEIRIWQRPRYQDELLADMRHRLIGHEPGLLVYWRFDESRGTVLNDQTENAYRGILNGGVEWVASDAPVGDHPGVRRTSFRFDGRTVVSGMTALLYYYQQQNKGGYDAEDKPLKTNARVMLAAATHPDSGGVEGVNHIAILDFGLSRSGKLGQIPDNILLENMEVSDEERRSSREIQEEITSLESREPELIQLINELNGNLNIPVDTDFIDAAYNFPGDETTAAAVVFKKENITLNWRDDSIEYLEDASILPEKLAMASWTFQYTEETVNVTFTKTVDDASVSSVEIVDDTALTPEQIVGTAEWLAAWCDWESTAGESESAFVVNDKYYYFKGEQYRVFDRETRTFSDVTNIDAGEFPGLWTDGIDAAFRENDGRIIFLKGAHYKSYIREDEAYVIQGFDTIHSIYPGVPFLLVHSEYQGNPPVLADVEAELASLRSRLSALRVELAAAQRRELEELEVEVEMFMIHTDPFGLSTMGGLLTFAWTDNTPQLFDSANGKLALYFQGANEQFYVTYYDTMTGTAIFSVPAGNNSEFSFHPRIVGPVKDTVITIEGDDEESCRVTLENPAVNLSEVWKKVPREATEFAGVLNGQGAARFLGRLDAPLSGTVSQVKLAIDSPIVINPGRVLQLGSTSSAIREIIPLTALGFDGADDSVDLPDGLIGDSGTIEMWIQFPEQLENQTIFDASTPQSGEIKGKYFYIDINSGKLRFGLEDDADEDFDAEALFLPLGTGSDWHHLAAVWDYNSPDKVAILYLDGVEIAHSEGPAGGRPPFLNPFLGASRSDYITEGFFKGALAEVSIRDHVMTPEAIAAEYNIGLLGIDPLNYNACWRFHETTDGPAAIDYSANAQNGTLVGAPALAAIDGGGSVVNLTPVALENEIPVGEPIYTDYDYDANKEVNHRGKEKSSVLFVVDAAQAEGSTPNSLTTGAAVASPTTRWIAYAQGSAMEFDGLSNDVKLADLQKLHQFDHDSDLTIESWIRPEPAAGKEFARFVHHYSDNSLYLAGYRNTYLQSAMNFNTDRNKKAVEWASRQQHIPFLEIQNWANAAIYAAISKFNNPSTRTREKVADAAERAARNSIKSNFIWLHYLVDYEQNRVGDLARDWALKWFDSHNDHVECANQPQLNPGSNSWTVELWFKAERTTGENILYNKDVLYEAAVRDGYFQFAWQPSWAWVKVDAFPVARNRWYHVALVYDGQKQKVYRNGQLIYERELPGSIGENTLPLLIGGRYLGNVKTNFFAGAIDEVRVWNVARSAEEIHNNQIKRLRGDEKGLMGYWHFDRVLAKDYSPYNNHGLVLGTPHGTASAMPGYAITAGIGNKINNSFSEIYLETKEVIPYFEWNHVSAVYNAAYALKFDNDAAYLDCGNNASLDLGKDLTLEVFFQMDDLVQPRGLLSKGQENSAYSLFITKDGRVAFTFLDETGKRHYFYAASDTRLETGIFYRVAVTRKHESQSRDVTETRTIDGEQYEISVPQVEEWDHIEIHVCKWNGQNYETTVALTKKYGGPKPAVNSDKLLIGRASSRDAAPFRGIIGEVRVWNRALERAESCKNIIGVESGLISWWKLDENQGYAAEDFTGTNHASINMANWLRNPDPEGAAFRILLNGAYLETAQVASPGNAHLAQGFGIGLKSDGSVQDAFKGTLEEMRIWRTVRTQEQIQDNLFHRLQGEKEDLIAYYTFDRQSDEELSELSDHSFRGNHLQVGQAAFVVSDAPISHDAFPVRNALLAVKTPFHEKIHSRPGIQEYGDMQYDAEGNLIGILKRCYSYIRNGEWFLITGFKVGNLVTEWLGQVQFNPELKGFVEGAPPVPSENLTAGPIDPAIFDYANSAAVEVVEADNVSYTYATSKEGGLNAGFGLSAAAGVDTTVLLITAPLGIGTAQEIADVNVLVGVEGKFDVSAGWSSENSVGAGRNLTKSTKVSLNGNWEDPDNKLNNAMQRRYQPFNMGFALVQSETADVFALRLEHNLALVSFQFRPNPDIPKDWNIIPFPINPRYTKQGTLDGAIGYNEQGKVTDPDYPNAREYGEHSYFKPKEAYSLKNRIVKEEQELINYFRSVDTNLGGAQDLAVNAGMGIIQGAAGGGASGAIDGLVKAVGGSGLPEKLGKQNLVNTYVWTADGGFFAETTETMQMKQETTGGTFSFSGEIGGSVGVDFSVAGVDVSLGFSAMLGGSLNLVKTKSKTSENSFRIDLSMDIPGDLQAYDDDLVRLYDINGKPLIVPGKVDAYRFMTFYLEPTNENFDTFFNNVVDPIWLQGNHPNALALKQAQQAEKKPPCWRVMHRVTFVSRILPDIPDGTAPELEKNMKAANVESNWQLIQKLDPFVRNKTGNYLEFSEAIRKAIASYLPELAPNEVEVIEYLSAYYQVFDD